MNQGTRRRLAVRLIVAALVWSLGLVLAALLISSYRGQTDSSGADGVTLTTRTFVQVHGIGSLALVLIPVAVSLVVAAALWRRERRGDASAERVAWAAVAALAVVAVLGITSLGGFMIPVVALLAASVWLVRTPAAAGVAAEH